MSEQRCARWDLPVGQCAHCRGDEIPTGFTPDWQERPRPVPPARPAPQVERPTSLGYYREPVLREIADLYLRLVEHLPAVSTGRSTENSAPYAAKPDPRRAPVRIEVHDLIARIEDEVPDLATLVCSTMGLMRCVVFPESSAAGRAEVDPRLVAALGTLDHHWAAFVERLPETAAEVARHLSRFAGQAHRLLGDTTAPVPLATPCPSCGQPTILRVQRGEEWEAVCVNPEDPAEEGGRRTWNETEWEDARFSVYSA